MNKTIFTTGILLGALSVILGAFGAHALEKVLDFDSLQSFETGVRYQMYHALLLLILSNVSVLNLKSKKQVYYLITTGIVLFSFSIYLLATNNLTSFNFKSIALITPIGGTILIVGWFVLGYKALKK